MIANQDRIYSFMYQNFSFVMMHKAKKMIWCRKLFNIINGGVNDVKDPYHMPLNKMVVRSSPLLVTLNAKSPLGIDLSALCFSASYLRFTGCGTALFSLGIQWEYCGGTRYATQLWHNNNHNHLSPLCISITVFICNPFFYAYVMTSQPQQLVPKNEKIIFLYNNHI